MKQIKFDGGGAQRQNAVAKQPATKKKPKPQGAKSPKKAQQNQKTSQKAKVDRARVEISLRSQGKLNHLDLEDALTTMGYSKDKAAKMKHDALQIKNARDLYEDYFVNPHFSDEE